MYQRPQPYSSAPKYAPAPSVPYTSMPDPPEAPSGGNGLGGLIWDGLKWVWKQATSDTGKEVIGAAADATSAYLDYQTRQRALDQQQDQWEKNYGLNQNEQGMRAQNAKNRAPLLDKGVYLAMNYKAPMPYQPRDFTRGVDQLRGAPTGGAAEQMRANAAAMANYRTGMGGTDSSVLDLILSRLDLPTNKATPPDGTIQSTPNAEMDYSQFTLGEAAKPTPDDQHVPVTAPQEAGSIPGLSSKVMATEYPDYFFPRGIPDDASPEVATQEWRRLYGNAPVPDAKTFETWWSAYRQVFNQAKRKGRSGA